MRAIIITLLSIFCFSTSYGQLWPHPLIFKGDVGPEYQYVLQNADFTDHLYIAGFRNFSEEFHFDYEGQLVSMWGARILSTNENIYVLLRMDEKSGEVIYNKSIVTEDQVHIVSHSIEGNKLVLCGFTKLGQYYGNLELYTMEYDLDTGDQISYDRVFVTNLIGFQDSYKAYRKDGRYNIYQNNRYVNDSKIVVSELSDEGITDIDTVYLSPGKMNIRTDLNPIENGYGFFNFGSDYLGNEEYEDSLFKDATFSYIVVNDEFQEVERRELYDLFPYGWEIRLEKETENHYIFYCAEGHGTPEGKSSARVFMDKDFNVVQVIDDEGTQAVIYDVDGNGDIYYLVSAKGPLYYIYNYSLFKYSDQDPIEVMSFRLNDIREITIKNIEVDDDNLYLKSYAKRYDNMNIITKIPFTK